VVRASSRPPARNRLTERLRPPATEIGVPAYAIDEQTAIKVVDGSVEVVSEGQWTKLRS
jgi:hypothetical protein